MMRCVALLLVAVAVPATACANDGATDADTSLPTLASLDEVLAGAPPLPPLDPAAVRAGEATYQQHCASCHQPDLSGASDWMIPNDDGTLKPPPQDSTGHTWHHPDQLLLEIVRDGIDVPTSRMPTFASTLTDDEILAVLEFIKASWGEQERAFQWEVTWQQRQRN